MDLFGKNNSQFNGVIIRSMPNQKFIGRHNELMVDWCNQCLVVHDGVTPGGCIKLCIPTPARLCDVLNDAPELGEIEGINLPETICTTLNEAPLLGTLTV